MCVRVEGTLGGGLCDSFILRSVVLEGCKVLRKVDSYVDKVLTGFARLKHRVVVNTGWSVCLFSRLSLSILPRPFFLLIDFLLLPDMFICVCFLANIFFGRVSFFFAGKTVYLSLVCCVFCLINIHLASGEGKLNQFFIVAPA